MFPVCGPLKLPVPPLRGGYYYPSVSVPPLRVGGVLVPVRFRTRNLVMSALWGLGWAQNLILSALLGLAGPKPSTVTAFEAQWAQNLILSIILGLGGPKTWYRQHFWTLKGQKPSAVNTFEARLAQNLILSVFWGLAKNVVPSACLGPEGSKTYYCQQC